MSKRSRQKKKLMVKVEEKNNTTAWTYLQEVKNSMEETLSSWKKGGGSATDVSDVLYIATSKQCIMRAYEELSVCKMLMMAAPNVDAADEILTNRIDRLESLMQTLQEIGEVYKMKLNKRL